MSDAARADQIVCTHCGYIASVQCGHAEQTAALRARLFEEAATIVEQQVMLHIAGINSGRLDVKGAMTDYVATVCHKHGEELAALLRLHAKLAASEAAP